MGARFVNIGIIADPYCLSFLWSHYLKFSRHLVDRYEK